MNIFVAKLNSDTNADHIKELFSQFGEVASCKVIMDRETRMSKCYGFVEMKNETEGASAIEHLNESNFMGNYIIVKKSEPRPQEKRSFDRKKSGEVQNKRFNRNSNREDGIRDGISFNRERNFNKYD